MIKTILRYHREEKLENERTLDALEAELEQMSTEEVKELFDTLPNYIKR